MLLVIITFFASIQYVFYIGIPENTSRFEFLFITSLIGFVLLLFAFSSELFRIDENHLKQSFILAIESLSYNFFLLLGSKNLDSTTISGVVSSYFIFIPIVEFIIFKTKPKLNIILAILFAVFGVFLILELNLNSLFNINILFLIITDILITINVITIGKFAYSSNPSILAMGQLFFITILSLLLWLIESKITKSVMRLPREPIFWGSVIIIGIFIKCFYTVIQIYAQRYVSPINVSLIFSTEIIMTLFLSNAVCLFFDYDISNEKITFTKCIGAILMVFGIFLSNFDLTKFIKRNQ